MVFGTLDLLLLLILLVQELFELVVFLELLCYFWVVVGYLFEVLQPPLIFIIFGLVSFKESTAKYNLLQPVSDRLLVLGLLLLLLLHFGLTRLLLVKFIVPLVSLQLILSILFCVVTVSALRRERLYLIPVTEHILIVANLVIDFVGK